MKSNFISNMGHDIRTPLIGLHGLTGILANKETDPKKKLFLAHLALLLIYNLSVFSPWQLSYPKIV